MTTARRLAIPALVVGFALAIATTTIVLGEAAAADTRERVRRAQIDLQTRLAQQIADDIVGEVRAVYTNLLVAAPIFGTGTPLVEAIRSDDRGRILREMLTFASAIRRPVTSFYVVRPDGRIESGVSTGEPLGPTGIGGAGSAGANPVPLNASEPNTRIGTLRMSSAEFAAAFATTRPYISSAYRPVGAAGNVLSTSDRISIGVRILDADRRSPIAALIAEVGVTELFGGPLLSLGTVADEAYAIDRQGRLMRRLSRANSPDPDAGRDLSGFEAIADARRGVSGVDRIDPYTSSTSLMTSTATKPFDLIAVGDIDLSWRFIAMRSVATLYAQVDDGLQQFRLGRWILALFLVAAALALGVVLDQVTAQRRALRSANARLADAAEEIAVVSRHKSEFLASMSHELRTPLNAVIGFSEVLLKQIAGTVNAKQVEYLEDIRASGVHLLALINDILDVSKVEAGRMELLLGEVSLPKVLDEGVTMIRERAGEHRITISLDVDPALGTLVADERKVKQVVANLLSNAVKFTPDGGRIAVQAARTAAEVRVAVEDTGVGIAPEDQARIFEEFEQAKHGREAAEGTGLGLTLSKKIVELHGGRIWVESEPGHGSRFTVALPLVPAGKEG